MAPSAMKSSSLLFNLTIILCHIAYTTSTMPEFYTKMADIPAVLQRSLSACGNSATVQDVSGVNVVTVRTHPTTSFTTADNPRAVRALLVYGEHARELISPELSFRLMEDLCTAISSPKTNTMRFSTSQHTKLNEVYMDSIADLARSRSLILKIVPVANKWGRQQVENGDFCRRTNEHGVDINRNYDAHWQAGTKSTPSDSFPGTAPFSESETQAIRGILTEFRPHIYLTIHSGTVGMYSPPAYTLQTPQSSSTQAVEEAAILRMLQKVAQDTDGGNVPIGTAAKTVGYLCPGTSLDYAFENVQAPYAFAFEVYESRSAQASNIDSMREARTDAHMARFAEKHFVVTSSCFGGHANMHDSHAATTFIESDSIWGMAANTRSRLRRRPRREDNVVDASKMRFSSAEIDSTLGTDRASSTASLGSFMTVDQCLEYFVPLDKTAFDRTMETWSARTARLLQLTHEQVLQDHIQNGSLFKIIDNVDFRVMHCHNLHVALHKHDTVVST